MGIPGPHTGPGIPAETAWRLGVMCEEDEDTEAAAAPARTTVRPKIRIASFIRVGLLIGKKWNYENLVLVAFRAGGDSGAAYRTGHSGRA